VVAAVFVGTLATPARASDPLTFLRMIGRPRLDAPEGVATDASGNVYVAEPNTLGGTATTNDRLVKFSADGTFMDVIAGPGTGAGQVADPSAVAIAPNGNIYVTEKWGSSALSNRVSYFDQYGNYIGSWGTYGTGNGQFEHPEGIAVDSVGNVYVADYLNDRIQKFTSSGGWIRSWTVSSPQGVAVDSSDVVYVAGGGQIRRFDGSGNALTNWASNGAIGIAFDPSDDAWVMAATAITEYDNTGSFIATYGSSGVGDGQLKGAEGIAIGAGGKVYVADTDNGRIQRLSAAGVYQTQWGAFPGTGVPDFPTGLAVDPSNNVYMTKKSTDQIQKFDVNGNLVQEFGGSGNGNGELSDPAAVAIDDAGSIYVLDTGNTRIQKFDPSGAYVTQWGSYGDCAISCSDGQVKAPTGIAVDDSGHVFVADTGNNRIEEFSASDGTFIRKWGVVRARGRPVQPAEGDRDRRLRERVGRGLGQQPDPGVRPTWWSHRDMGRGGLFRREAGRAVGPGLRLGRCDLGGGQGPHADPAVHEHRGIPVQARLGRPRLRTVRLAHRDRDRLRRPRPGGRHEQPPGPDVHRPERAGRHDHRGSGHRDHVEHGFVQLHGERLQRDVPVQAGRRFVRGLRERRQLFFLQRAHGGQPHLLGVRDRCPREPRERDPVHMGGRHDRTDRLADLHAALYDRVDERVVLVHVR
jgi:uncharacterized protein YjiK